MEQLLTTMELLVLLYLVSEDCPQDWRQWYMYFKMITCILLTSQSSPMCHCTVFTWIVLMFPTVQEISKHIFSNIMHLWWLKNALSYKQSKTSSTKGKLVCLYSSYPSGMTDHKSKCGPHNEFATNVNTNLFLPGEYCCYRYYHWKRTLIQKCLITR